MTHMEESWGGCCRVGVAGGCWGRQWSLRLGWGGDQAGAWWLGRVGVPGPHHSGQRTGQGCGGCFSLAGTVGAQAPSPTPWPVCSVDGAPILAGGFLTTVPPGKFNNLLLMTTSPHPRGWSPRLWQVGSLHAPPGSAGAAAKKLSWACPREFLLNQVGPRGGRAPDSTAPRPQTPGSPAPPDRDRRVDSPVLS